MTPSTRTNSNQTPLLDVQDLRISFQQNKKHLEAIRGISFQLKHKQTLAVVGESGCGKSTIANAITRLLPPAATIKSGTIHYQTRHADTIDLVKLRPHRKEMRELLGKDFAMIFQEASSSLNPVYRVGMQMREVLRFHTDLSSKEIDQKCLALLERVGIPSPHERMKNYPFELSGGMCQRIMIAIALASRPRLLICDEPTTALDVTIQDQILDLIERIQKEEEGSILFITHDLSLVSELADEVMIMYLGEAVEQGPTAEVFTNPLHPYTQGLFASLPVLGSKGKKLTPIKGEVPSLSERVIGCPFAARCPDVMARCRKEAPPTFSVGIGKNQKQKTSPDKKSRPQKMPPSPKSPTNRNVSCWLYE